MYDRPVSLPAPTPAQRSLPQDQETRTSQRQSRSICFEEYLILSDILFEWAESYDSKDWQRLEAILAPVLLIDHSQLNNRSWPAMQRDEFINTMRSQALLGDSHIRTQHHIGASKWEKQSDDYVIGYHQLRVAHQRHSAMDRRTIENEGNGHSMIEMFYRRLDGEWKIAGIKPTVCPIRGS